MISSEQPYSQEREEWGEKEQCKGNGERADGVKQEVAEHLQSFLLWDSFSALRPASLCLSLQKTLKWFIFGHDHG